MEKEESGMEKKIAKSTKVILGVAVVIIVILLCCLFVLKSRAKNTWKEGIYPFDFDINVCVSDKDTSFGINSIVVGEEILNLVKEGNVRLVMTGPDTYAEGECRWSSYYENGKAYHVGLKLCPELIPGEYKFHEIQLWSGTECLAIAKGDAVFTIVEDKEEEIDCRFVLSDCRVDSFGYEFSFLIENKGTEQLEILDLDDRPESMIGQEKITIVNNIESQVHEFYDISPEICEFPVIIEPGKKAHMQYTIPITEEGMFYNEVICPALICAGKDTTEPVKVVLALRDITPIINVTQKQIAEYIAERGTK